MHSGLQMLQKARKKAAWMVVQNGGVVDGTGSPKLLVSCFHDRSFGVIGVPRTPCALTSAPFAASRMSSSSGKPCLGPYRQASSPLSHLVYSLFSTRSNSDAASSGRWAPAAPSSPTLHDSKHISSALPLSGLAELHDKAQALIAPEACALKAVSTTKSGLQLVPATTRRSSVCCQLARDDLHAFSTQCCPPSASTRQHHQRLKTSLFVSRAVRRSPWAIPNVHREVDDMSTSVVAVVSTFCKALESSSLMAGTACMRCLKGGRLSWRGGPADGQLDVPPRSIPPRLDRIRASAMKTLASCQPIAEMSSLAGWSRHPECALGTCLCSPSSLRERSSGWARGLRDAAPAAWKKPQFQPCPATDGSRRRGAIGYSLSTSATGSLVDDDQLADANASVRPYSAPALHAWRKVRRCPSTTAEAMNHDAQHASSLRPPRPTSLPLGQEDGALYLGSMAAALDLGPLQDHFIRHLVQVLEPPQPVPSLSGDPRELEWELKYLRIEIDDDPGPEAAQKLAENLTPACDYIGNALGRRESVLVHCHQGVSRSAAVVIAFLVRDRGMSYAEALEFVKERRFCVKPNQGFVEVLREWEKTCLSLRE
uniref:protein-tyrosine-phosphatase n=1 Tax=Mycena chlorophos TaxID=658473 RepID=A0ABQ0LEE8_MYCCL|nr:phosphotyrosine protein phosphatase II [Mycena chlorophos]